MSHVDSHAKPVCRSLRSAQHSSDNINSTTSAALLLLCRGLLSSDMYVQLHVRRGHRQRSSPSCFALLCCSTGQ